MSGGMPRALSLRRRRRRQALATRQGVSVDSTDIKTHEKVIQVVAPGDMAFSLSAVEVTDVTADSSLLAEASENLVCVSTTSVVATGVLLLLLLTISCLVSGFLYIKMRQMTKVSFGEAGVTYDNPVLMNSLSYSGLAAVIAK